MSLRTERETDSGGIEEVISSLGSLQTLDQKALSAEQTALEMVLSFLSFDDIFPNFCVASKHIHGICQRRLEEHCKKEYPELLLPFTDPDLKPKLTYGVYRPFLQKVDFSEYLGQFSRDYEVLVVIKDQSNGNTLCTGVYSWDIYDWEIVDVPTASFSISHNEDWGSRFHDCILTEAMRVRLSFRKIYTNQVVCLLDSGKSEQDGGLFLDEFDPEYRIEYRTKLPVLDQSVIVALRINLKKTETLADGTNQYTSCVFDPVRVGLFSPEIDGGELRLVERASFLAALGEHFNTALCMQTPFAR